MKKNVTIHGTRIIQPPVHPPIIMPLPSIADCANSLAGKIDTTWPARPKHVELDAEHGQSPIGDGIVEITDQPVDRHVEDGLRVLQQL